MFEANQTFKVIVTGSTDQKHVLHVIQRGAQSDNRPCISFVDVRLTDYLGIPQRGQRRCWRRTVQGLRL